MMNSSFELGGCCLARHGAAAYFPSKTEEILSRYRPIAPKPAGAPDAAQPCSPAVAARPSRSAGRKRSCCDVAVSNPPRRRAHKRAAAAAGGRAPRCSAEVGTSSSNNNNKPSGGGADTSEEAVSALCETSDSAATKNYYHTKFAYPPLRPQAALPGGDFDSAITKTTAVLLEKDAAFMERAAASASPSNADYSGRSRGEDLVTLPLLPLASSSPRHSPPGKSKPATLEQFYTASPDPLLLLTDASRQVLWFNPAYQMASAAQAPLGAPVPLSTFALSASAESSSSSAGATLWGFTRKSRGRVIMPQPVRAVGSTVSVECIVEATTDLQAPSALLSMEDVEHDLESEPLPSLISDANNRVRWVNSAYKQMVGQPECPWLQSTATANNNNNSNGRERMNGEVVLVTSNIKQRLPDKGSFTGRVKIQWTSGGAKTSLTLPSDVNVVRIPPPDSNQYVYAWRLDIRAALRLTC